MGWKKFYESQWFIIGGALVLVLLAFAYARAWYQEYRINQEIAALESEANSLAVKKIQILDNLHYVQSPAFVEDKARTELNLAKDGEHMLVLDRAIGNSLATSKTNVIESDNNHSSYQRWFSYFIH